MILILSQVCNFSFFHVLQELLQVPTIKGELQKTETWLTQTQKQLEEKSSALSSTRKTMRNIKDKNQVRKSLQEPVQYLDRGQRLINILRVYRVIILTNSPKHTHIHTHMHALMRTHDKLGRSWKLKMRSDQRGRWRHLNSPLCTRSASNPITSCTGTVQARGVYWVI